MSEPMWKQYGLLGETPVLQFVNTVDDPGKSRDENTLPDWRSVMDWTVAAGVLSADERAIVEPSGDADALAHLLDLRESMWGVLHAAAVGVEADTADLRRVRETVAAAIGDAALHVAKRSLFWQLDAKTSGADIVAKRVALDFLDLMEGDALMRLRECERCTAIYLNQGRGPGRKWCRMRTCGSRDKVARYRKRVKGAD